MNGYVVVEGHGEVQAMPRLLFSLAADLGLPPIYWRPPMRRPITSERVAADICSIVRTKRNVDCLLVVRDEDDECPAMTGPELSKWLAKQNLPFPAAVTLLHREYEALFLPCIDVLAGQSLVTASISRPGLLSGTSFTGNPESIRDVKGWLSDHFPPGTEVSADHRPTAADGDAGLSASPHVRAAVLRDTRTVPPVPRKRSRTGRRVPARCSLRGIARLSRERSRACVFRRKRKRWRWSGYFSDTNAVAECSAIIARRRRAA